MRLSVVIPSYNCERYLPLAIDSVLSQSRAADELIVIDDGSRDDSEALVRRRYGDRVRYVKQANAGPSAARNHGIRLASGDVIGLLDADDIWLPGVVEKVLDALARHPQVALVTADKQAIDSEGVVTIDSWWQRHGVFDMLAEARGAPLGDALGRLARVNFVNTSLAFVRRSALDGCGLFDEAIRYGEDYELWLRLTATHGLICLPEVLGQYRLHAHNSTRATEPMLKDFVLVARRMRDWGRNAFLAAGFDTDLAVARALADLGYWYFSAGRMREARLAFRDSLRERPTPRALKYAALGLLPAALLMRLKHRRNPTP